MDEKQTLRIVFEPTGRRLEMPAGETVLTAAQKAGTGLIATCNGRGTCHQCIIKLVSGRLNPITAIERGALSNSSLNSGLRLACQAVPITDVTINIPLESTSTSQRLQLEGLEVELTPDLNSHVAGLLPPGQELYGLAVDIGTTKVAAYLVNLDNGQTIAKGGTPNPQIAYGEDVISRIAYANLGAAETEILRSTLAEAIKALIMEVCRDGRVENRQIVDAVVVGNTAMDHIFAGLPTRPLGEAPYTPARLEEVSLPAETLGLDLAPGALIYRPPVIAGFVGSDHVAADLACGLTGPGENALLVDIGTNTEITLRTPDGLICCSCASGPAFEGAHIHAGMRAASGAIERVFHDQDGWRYQTIDGKPAVGICGSGILDAVAEMRRIGIIDERGTLKKDAAGVEQMDQGWAFHLVNNDPGSGQKAIYITRRDVNEIQLAKAAIRAGIEIVLNSKGMQASQLKKVIVAGAFGTYLHLTSALAIGMFPELPEERFFQAGNAAGAGARMMLVSEAARQKAVKLQECMQYIELTAYKHFQDIFVAALPVTSRLVFR
jgi:uncharacterized 2Fe-2S/4Fe-4S cluster protein (DUF4445 family)